MTRLRTLIAVLLTLAAAIRAQAEPSPDEVRAGETFFETKVRPILADNCYKCHGAEKQKANLRVDSLRSLLAGGDSGPALVPGDADHSLLIHVIGYSDDYVQMPPSKKLPDENIAALKKWVSLGAPWPGADREAARRPSRPAFEITDADRAYWAYQPIRRPPPPKASRGEGSSLPIDAFIGTQLEMKGLEPNGPATQRELIRRATFDLIGLPPSPEEVTAFEQDESPDAYAKLIDRLLARPEYGERWGRHWLDVVRFAQSNGYERDDEKPMAWRYRDYVIRAFNEDKPYDQFITEQLAGDELSPVTNDSLIATGFYRLGVWDDEPDDNRMAEFDELDDVMVSTGAAFLGLTVGCARCHDHMFDPIPQADYYRLLSFFRNMRPYEKPNFGEQSATLVNLPGDAAAAAKYYAERKAAIEPLEQQLDELEKEKEGEGTKEKKDAKKRLRDEIEKIKRKTPPFEHALAVRERGPTPPATHVLIRGNAGTPGDEVQPAFLTVLGGVKPVLPPRSAGDATTGRRMTLARWLTDKQNPLPARVMANRVWKHHFGQGIVKTTTDFGRAGVPPTHPELLDWLAAEFQDGGWSVKHLHRVIMLSDAYRRSSNTRNSAASAVDPGNDLYWRQSLHRLEAEAIRDSVLAVSGTLNREMGGRGFFPQVGADVLAGASKPGHNWELSSERQQSRRSVYMFVMRTLVPPQLDLFDYNNTAQPVGERATTTVAPQALLLLNDRFMLAQSEALAERLIAEAGDNTSKQIERAYRLAFGRSATPEEVRLASEFVARQRDAFAKLGSRYVLKPLVPGSLFDAFLAKLAPTDLIEGPREGWTYTRGLWSNGYQGVKAVDPLRGPAALWNGPKFADGTLQAEITLANASELGAVILRAAAEGDVFRGYEVTLDPRAGTVSLRRHGAELTLLGEAEVPIETGRPIPLKATIDGAHWRVWTGKGKPVLDLVDPEPLNDAGRIGLRTWGAAMTVDNLTIATKNNRWDVANTNVGIAADASADAPLAGWEYFGGRWSQTDDDGYTVEPSPGAKAIWNEPALGDGEVTAQVMLRSQQGDAGLVLRVNRPTSGVDALVAYNINLRAGGLRLGKHDNNWRSLVNVPMKVELDRWHNVRVSLDSGRIRIWLDGAREPQIDFTDDEPLPAGAVGMRTFNSHCAFRNLEIKTGERTWQADFRSSSNATTSSSMSKERKSPERRALEALCLLIFNLNEFVYVD